MDAVCNRALIRIDENNAVYVCNINGQTSFFQLKANTKGYYYCGNFVVLDLPEGSTMQASDNRQEGYLLNQYGFYSRRIQWYIDTDQTNAAVEPTEAIEFAFMDVYMYFCYIEL